MAPTLGFTNLEYSMTYGDNLKILRVTVTREEKDEILTIMD